MAIIEPHRGLAKVHREMLRIGIKKPRGNRQPTRVTEAKGVISFVAGEGGWGKLGSSGNKMRADQITVIRLPAARTRNTNYT